MHFLKDFALTTSLCSNIDKQGWRGGTLATQTCWGKAHGRGCLSHTDTSWPAGSLQGSRGWGRWRRRWPPPWRVPPCCSDLAGVAQCECSLQTEARAPRRAARTRGCPWTPLWGRRTRCPRTACADQSSHFVEIRKHKASWTCCRRHRGKTPRPSHSRGPAGPGRPSTSWPRRTSPAGLTRRRRSSSPTPGGTPGGTSPQTPRWSSGPARAARTGGPAAPRWQAAGRSLCGPAWGLGPDNMDHHRVVSWQPDSPYLFQRRERHRCVHQTSSLGGQLWSLATGWDT